jgi:hypothetical protein
VSFLQKAKDKATEAAREAADATSKVAGAVSARAHDPDTQEKVKGGLASAGKTAGDASVRVADVSARTAGAVVSRAQDPVTQAKVRDGIASAGRGARTMVERIDPGILAEVVIKATALQEKANARLRQRGSIYRIGEIQVTASLPPGISFSIERVSEPGHDAGTALHTSTEILAGEAVAAAVPGADGAPAIVSLDGEQQAAVALGTGEVDASLDVAVDAIAASGAAPDAWPQDGRPA